MEYRFGQWLADQTDYKNSGLEECINAVPSASGYQPAYNLVASGDTVSGAIIGARGFRKADGTPVVACATVSDLYVVIGGTATASSLSLALDATSDRVVFEQFGTKVYATTKNGDTWVLDNIESDTSFAAATGSPPEANAMARVDDFLIMGDLTDIDTFDSPYRIRWSQFNNPDGTWGTDVATQSGKQDLNSKYGPITNITGGTFGLIFQRDAISRIDYNGTKTVFSLDIYERERGCVAPQSVVQVGDVVYFLSYDGFFSTDGASVESISQARIWKWFLQNSNQVFIADVVGAVDWERRCVVWAIPGNDEQALRWQLWYNWETGTWGSVEQSVEFLVFSAKSGLTLEQVAAIYPDLDAMPISLDSPTFQASGRTMLAFTGGQLATFTGETLPTTFTSGSMQPTLGKRSFVRGVTPLIANESENTTVALGYRDRMTKAYIVSPAVLTGPIGYAPHNIDARYFRVTVSTPEGALWSDAYGAQVDFSPSGDV